MTEQELLAVPWFAVQDDTIGGWAIATVDKPVSQIDSRGGTECELGVFLTETIARRVVALHNEALRQ